MKSVNGLSSGSVDIDWIYVRYREGIIANLRQLTRLSSSGFLEVYCDTVQWILGGCSPCPLDIGTWLSLSGSV